MNDDILSQALATFVEEARDLLDQMEILLLRAEQGDSADGDLHALFRCAHTIKGSGGLFGLAEVERFTHAVENVLDRLRNGHIRFDSELAGLLLECQKCIRCLVDAAVGGCVVAPEQSEALLARLQAYSAAARPLLADAVSNRPVDVPERAVSVVSALSDGSVEASSATPGDHWHLSLRFSRGILHDGMDPLSFIAYLSNFGTLLHVETIVDALPEFAAADPELCYLGFEIALQSRATKAEIESVFDFIRDVSQIVILPPDSKIADYIALIDSMRGEVGRIGEILVACGSITAHELEQALAKQRFADPATPLGQVLVGSGGVQPAVVEAAAEKQKQMHEKRLAEARFVKVPADRLDALIDRVGELVIAGAGMQSQIAALRRPDVQESSGILLALVEDIRDMALGLRMVTIGEVFARFPRIVRDVSRELGKKIELRISGAECELDKVMVDKIGDPLMHLLRNSMDHGIEPEEVRVANGKPACGTVELNAYHESGAIHIEVRDDGRGLDRERILRKAVEKGMVAPESKLSDHDIDRLILAPGFSTADQVTSLSGRGVGMDVVASNIEQLRGSLEIESVPGRGTTFRLSLPLTLAIIDGFHVGVGSAHFIIPLDMVDECIELSDCIGHSEVLDLRGEALPFIRLRAMFGELGAEHPRPRVIVVRSGNRSAGLVVDRIYGKCQTVIKPLGPLFVKSPCISGSSIIGNGEIGMILDIPALIRQAIEQSRSRGRTASRAPSPSQVLESCVHAKQGKTTPFMNSVHS